VTSNSNGGVQNARIRHRASGHIASAVIPELIGSGHQVVGLARSDASAEAVAALGAEVRRGDLDDLDGLRQAASDADGVIHLASNREAMRTGDFMGAVDSDLAAIKAIGETLIGTGNPSRPPAAHSRSQLLGRPQSMTIAVSNKSISPS
jgi:uncharacterized protein YbjT (DUF2867 family)